MLRGNPKEATMSRALWTPRQTDSERDQPQVWERPFLQLPAPMPPMPVEHTPVESEEDAPRVIVIDI
jgi:hypothetical protein